MLNQRETLRFEISTTITTTTIITTITTITTISS